MDKYESIRNNLLSKIENHTMTILKDDEFYRHISFSNNGSNFYKFDIITWPGYLSICGDIGNYSFSRSTDMFKFFRNEKPSFGYWAEKCVSEDTSNKNKRIFRGVF